MRDTLTEKKTRLRSIASDVASVRQEWQAEALAFVHQLHAADTERHQVRKSYHRSAYKWLCCADQTLQILCNTSLRDFVVTPEVEARDAMTWPTLGLSMDQGGDGWSAQWFLRHAGWCGVVSFDQAHRAWNDCRNAMKNAGVWPDVISILAIMNYDSGPWREKRFHKQCLEGLLEYLEVSVEGDAIREELRPWLLKECNAEHLLVDEEVEEQIQEHLLSSLRCQIPRVGLCRWFGWQQSVTQLLRTWTARTIAMMYLCVQDGILERPSVLSGMNERFVEHVGRDMAEGSREQTGGEKEELELKSRQQVSMDTTLSLLLDRQLRTSAMLVERLCRPLKEWHSDQCKTNRSSNEASEWSTAMACGLWLKHVRDTLELLHTWDFWHEIEVSSSWPCNAGELSIEHPLVKAQQELVEKSVSLAIELVRCRCQSMSWHMYPPGRLAGLGSDDHAADVLSETRALRDAKKSAAEQGKRFWRNLADRSLMSCKCVEQFVAVAERDGWSPSGDLKTLHYRHFAGVSATKIVEDSIRSQRMGEVSRNFRKQLSETRSWHQLVSGTVPGSLHRFKVANTDAVQIPPGLNESSLKAMSHLQPSLCSSFLREQITASKNTPWYSPGPSHAVVQREDAALLLYCHEKSAWDRAERFYWSSMLCNGPNLALRSKKEKNSRWWLSLGTKGGASVLAWPLKELVNAGLKYFLLDTCGSPFFKAVLNFREFEAVTVSWSGPLQQRAHGKGIPKMPLLGIPSITPRTLLEVAASNAFWTLPKTQLHQLIRGEGLKVESGQDLTQCIEQLYRHIYPNCTDEELAAALMTRMPARAVRRSDLSVESCADLLDQSDRAEMKEKSDQSSSESALQASLAKRVQSLQKTASKSAKTSGVATSSSSSAAKSGRQGTISGGGRRYPDKVPKPSKHLTQCEAERLLPSSYRLYPDESEQRWLLSSSTHAGYNSRSWSRYGYNDAAKLLIELAWARHHECGGESMPFKLDGW
eukprot:1562765-Amphidinium_carterae.3